MLTLPACTILAFDIEPMEENKSVGLNNENKLSLEVLKFGNKDKLYEDIALKVLNLHGICEVPLVGLNEAESQHLSIEITEYGNGGALPQEWLTGLSFGAIPSWGTRKGMYTYQLTYYKNRKYVREVKYSIDQKSYSWIVFFPFFWINFFTLLEPYEYYKQGITEFMFGDLNTIPVSVKTNCA